MVKNFAALTSQISKNEIDKKQKIPGRSDDLWADCQVDNLICSAVVCIVLVQRFGGQNTKHSQIAFLRWTKKGLSKLL